MDDSNTEPEHREIQRTYGGATYWIRRAFLPDRWIVTADGVTIQSPASWEQSLAALDAVAPLER